MLHYTGHEKACQGETVSLIWPICKLQIKLSVENTMYGDHIHNSSFYLSLMNRPNKLECYITLGMKRLAREKQSNLFGPIVSYKENKVL